MRSNKLWWLGIMAIIGFIAFDLSLLAIDNRILIKETSRTLIKEMRSETVSGSTGWTMIYRYQVNGLDTVAFLEDMNGNGDLSEELEEHRAYLRRFGDIVNEPK